MSIGEEAGRGLRYDPNRPTGGGNFNPNMKIDLSHISVAPPAPPPSLAPGGGLGGSRSGGVGGSAGGTLRPPVGPGGSGPGASGPAVRIGRGNAPKELVQQLQRDVEAWIDGVPWGAIHPAAISGVVKGTINGMARQYGLTLIW
jgi:hypothetical protein